MPLENNIYFAHGPFQPHVLSCQSQAVYDCAWDLTHLSSCPYLSPTTIALCMESRDDWYHHPRHDLHLVDPLFQACIQMVCQISQCVERFPNQDQMLERLMAEGLFDWCEPDHTHTAEEHTMWMSIGLSEWLLEQIENLKSWVWFLSGPLCLTSSLVSNPIVSKTNSRI